MINAVNGNKFETSTRVRGLAVRIICTVLLVSVFAFGTVMVLNAAHRIVTDSAPVKQADKFAYIEVIPLEMLEQLSNVEDDRELIDRLTIDMIADIPLTELNERDDLSPILDY